MANTVVVDVEGNVQFSDVSSHNISVNNFDVTSFRALHKISQLRRRHLVSAPTRLKWLKTAARKCRAYLWGRGSARESVPFSVCVCVGVRAGEIYFHWPDLLTNPKKLFPRRSHPTCPLSFSLFVHMPARVLDIQFIDVCSILSVRHFNVSLSPLSTLN